MSIGLQDARGVPEGVVGAGAERYHREEVAAAIAAGTARHGSRTGLAAAARCGDAFDGRQPSSKERLKRSTRQTTRPCEMPDSMRLIAA